MQRSWISTSNPIIVVGNKKNQKKNTVTQSNSSLSESESTRRRVENTRGHNNLTRTVKHQVKHSFNANGKDQYIAHANRSSRSQSHSPIKSIKGRSLRVASPSRIQQVSRRPLSKSTAPVIEDLISEDSGNEDSHGAIPSKHNDQTVYEKNLLKERTPLTHPRGNPHYADQVETTPPMAPSSRKHLLKSRDLDNGESPKQPKLSANDSSSHLLKVRINSIIKGSKDSSPGNTQQNRIGLLRNLKSKPTQKLQRIQIFLGGTSFRTIYVTEASADRIVIQGTYKSVVEYSRRINKPLAINLRTAIVRLTEYFIDLPAAAPLTPSTLPIDPLYSDYYSIIRSPLSLHDVLCRAQNHYYSSAFEWICDLRLVCECAWMYFEKDHPTALGASILWKFLHDRLSHLTMASSNHQPASTSTPSTQVKSAKSFKSRHTTVNDSIAEDFTELSDNLPLRSLSILSSRKLFRCTFLLLPSSATDPQFMPSSLPPQPILRTGLRSSSRHFSAHSNKRASTMAPTTDAGRLLYKTVVEKRASMLPPSVVRRLARKRGKIPEEWPPDWFNNARCDISLDP